MSYNASITKLDSYREYLATIQAVPTYQLERCFACGLPAVWLYMKSLDLEDVFFDILKDVKSKKLLFKELIYLLMLTNKQNKYYCDIPTNFLQVKIPQQVLDAQIELDKAEFEVAYSFTRTELIATLKMLAKPNKMLHLGNRKKAVGIMFSDNYYSVYHAENPSVLKFKDVESCVDAIIRIMK